MADLLTGTVTFLFSDIEGSTALLKRLGDRYEEVVKQHDLLLREAFDEVGGRVIDTQGDAFFVAFPRAKDAVIAAVVAQRALGAHAWPDAVEVRVRMGVHTGEPTVGSERYVGLGVHRAARICAVGRGGQILVSQTTRELLREDPPSDAKLRDVGEQQLKDLDEPEHLYQVVAPGLRDDFRPLRTVSRQTGRAGGHEFRVLGPLEVMCAEQPVRLGGQKQRALLGILVLNAGRVVSTDRLIDQLWGEDAPRTAGTSLQNFISQLRKTLGSDRLVTRPPGYLLAAEPHETDLGRFEQSMREARNLPSEERATKLREALELWRGPPLADLTFESFAQAEIRRLEELRLAAIEERIEADLELGDHAELVGELQTLAEQNPLRERLRGQLMLALYRSGRQAEALQAYHDARRALVDELGIEPSPALQHLHASILRQEVALQPAGSTKAADEDHATEVIRALLAGRLIPVLGPGTGSVENIADRLAESFECPPESRGDLTRVSQYIAVTRGVGPLYDELHELFAEESEPTSVHRLFARVPPILRARGAQQELLVTASYGRALERAFEEAGEEIDVISYCALGRDRGKFVHRQPDGVERVIDLPNTYGELSLEQRPVILKIHGEVDLRPERERESFVVSEDDYIAYLSQTELAGVVPVTLAAKLRRSHYLFLGYPLVEWNLRVFLHRVFGDEPISYRSWAIQPAAEPIHREFWRKREVDVFDVPIDDYATMLDERLSAEAAETVG